MNRYSEIANRGSLPDAKLQEFGEKLERMNRINNNPAGWMYDRLQKYIQEFEAGLSSDQEIGAQLVSFGRDIVFHITSMGYHGPDLVTFHGVGANGERLQLVQHISQVNVLFTALPKVGETARRIGFPKAAGDNEE
ncbi:MAG: hypothetical protein EOP84_25725 [Verrucomicrobiaceae bacterium]|nr:MAG: hypothetical protein EOP84_25725 [Verrucomicrobiaceae bacterium]